MFDGPTEHVFLDTEVFVRFGFQYLSTALKIVAHLIKLGRLTLVITDIVTREVEAQIDKAIRAAHNAQKKFSQEDGRILGSSGIKEVADKIVWFDKKAAVEDLHERFHKFLADNKAIVIKTADVPVSEILDDYFNGNHPVGSGEPKPEFPDAINVKALIAGGKRMTGTSTW